MSIKVQNLGLALGVLATATACSQLATPGSPSPIGPTAASTALGQVRINNFQICKVYVGAAGPTVTINVTVDDSANGLGIDSQFSTTLVNGECKDIWADTTNGADLVTVTEQVPGGYTASYVRTLDFLGNITTDPSVNGNSTSGLVSNGDRGVLVVFTNTADTPPPPTGTQGCTPGYWKQTQHYDSWPAPYTPTMLFSSVFENAFPGMTLDDVLGQGGGDLKALGRHTVAALLNAQSQAVSYPLATQQVITGFNNVFPGGNYELLKNRWAAFNELGCPLN